MQKLNVSLDTFAGPLDLLLHLINKNKIDIYDIPIATITSQYMEYIEDTSFDMDGMSEFIVMASTLLEIKARMLLPKIEQVKEEDSVDPRAELVEKLLEYKLYKHLALELNDRFDKNTDVFYGKSNIPQSLDKYIEKPDPLQLLDEVTLSDLQEVFNSILLRYSDKKDDVRHNFNKVKKDEVTVEDRKLFLEKLLEREEKISFLKIFDKLSSKSNIIVTFLALLELIKIDKIYVVQERLFGDILIIKRLDRLND